MLPLSGSPRPRPETTSHACHERGRCTMGDFPHDDEPKLPRFCFACPRFFACHGTANPSKLVFSRCIKLPEQSTDAKFCFRLRPRVASCFTKVFLAQKYE